MRVQVNNAVAVGPDATSFGEIAGRWPTTAPDAGPRTPRGGIVVRAERLQPRADHPRRRDRAGVRRPTVERRRPLPGADRRRRSTTASATSSSQVDRAAAGVAPAASQREVTTVAAGAGELAVATFNVENLDPGDPPAKFAALAGADREQPAVARHRRPRGDPGQQRRRRTTAIVDADADAATLLIAAIQAAGGPTYQFRQIDPVDDQDGGEPGGNIRVGFLFRTDRGLRFVDRPGGDVDERRRRRRRPGRPAADVQPGPHRPDRTRPSTPAASRWPASSLFNGQTLFVIANHFNSKGGDEPLFGRFQPPARRQRGRSAHQQAQIVQRLRRRGILARRPERERRRARRPQRLRVLAAARHPRRAASLTDADRDAARERALHLRLRGQLARSLDHILVSDRLLATARRLRHRARQRRVRRPGQRPRPAGRALRRSGACSSVGDGR